MNDLPVKSLSLSLLIGSALGTSHLAYATPKPLLTQPTNPNTQEVLTSALTVAATRANHSAAFAHELVRPSTSPQFDLLPLNKIDFRNNTLLAKGVSKSAAANAAKKKYGGKVLKVSKNAEKYRVKLLLDNGRIKIVSVDAATGKAR